MFAVAHDHSACIDEFAICGGGRSLPVRRVRYTRVGRNAVRARGPRRHLIITTAWWPWPTRCASAPLSSAPHESFGVPASGGPVPILRTCAVTSRARLRLSARGHRSSRTEVNHATHDTPKTAVFTLSSQDHVRYGAPRRRRSRQPFQNRGICRLLLTTKELTPLLKRMVHDIHRFHQVRRVRSGARKTNQELTVP